MNYTQYMLRVETLNFNCLNPTTYQLEPYNYNLDFSVDGLENFSLREIRNRIQYYMNSLYQGYNNKLWIPVNDDPQIKIEEDSGQIQIETPIFKSICSTSNTQFVNFSDVAGSIKQNIHTDLQQYFTKANIETTIRLENFYVPKDLFKNGVIFSYITCANAKSDLYFERSPFYCKPICFMFDNKEKQPILLPVPVLKRMTATLKDAIFLYEEYIKENDGENIHYEYYDIQDCMLSYSITYQKEFFNFIILNKIPTLSTILEWFIENYKKELNEYGVYKINISDGLNGIVIYLE